MTKLQKEYCFIWRGMLRSGIRWSLLAVVIAWMYPICARAEFTFSSPVKVSDDSIGMKTNVDRSGKATASGGGAIYTTWIDWRNSRGGWDSDIYIAKSTDGGKTFGPNVRVTNATGNNNYPSIAADSTGRYVFVVWHGSAHIYFARSTDGGVTFETPIRVDTNYCDPYQGRGTVTTDKTGNVYVIWEERGGCGFPVGVYLAKSTDHGASFADKILVSLPSMSGLVLLATDISVDDAGNVYVAWMDNYWPTAHIVLSASTNGGANFTSHVTLDPSWVGQTYPQVVSRGDGEVLVTWNGRISHSSDRGLSFSPPTRLGDTSAGLPGLAKDTKGNFYATWIESSTGVIDIRMSRSTDGGRIFEPSVKVNDRLLGTPTPNMLPVSPSIAASDEGEVAITWTDTYNGNNAIYAASSATGDITPPISVATVAGTSGANGWYTSGVTVTLSATDDYSGVARTEYSFDSSTWNLYTAPITISTDGLVSVFLRAVDVAGNVEQPKQLDISIDATPPTITFGGIADGAVYTFGAAPTPSFTPFDAVSGLAGSSATLTGGNGTGFGSFTYTVTAVDVAGNTTTSSVSYSVNPTPGAISTLIDSFLASGAINNSGIATSLKTKMDAVQAAGDAVAKANIINAFINQLAAQSGKQITVEAATILTAAAKLLLIP
ncbi:MAG: hypothetical protein A2X82_01255 [Geobacteraceae bacterium GWC2_55_20]|nr:MAG: hypothetical protein A2X82_01255 [Geobacteraceae bacterium GWC2_55_20]OGU25714.1 MAG: hypothetical protein A2X85_14210 [Geobacteraceae bacterium GWF2_54_21]HCE68584.1 hypothetical protein [Geobacter sp.]